MDTSLREKIFDLFHNQDKQHNDQRGMTQQKKDTQQPSVYYFRNIIR